MRWIWFFIILFIVTLVNASTLMDAAAIGSLNIKPDLLLIMLVFFAINCETSDAILCSFAIGFAADISGSSMTMGPHIISFGIMGSALSFLRRSVIMRNLIYQGLCIFIVGLVSGMMAEGMIYSKLSGYSANSFITVALSSIYSAIIGPVIWLGFTAMFRLLVPNQPKSA